MFRALFEIGLTNDFAWTENKPEIFVWRMYSPCRPSFIFEYVDCIRSHLQSAGGIIQLAIFTTSVEIAYTPLNRNGVKYALSISEHFNAFYQFLQNILLSLSSSLP